MTIPDSKEQKNTIFTYSINDIKIESENIAKDVVITVKKYNNPSSNCLS